MKLPFAGLGYAYCTNIIYELCQNGESVCIQYSRGASG